MTWRMSLSVVLLAIAGLLWTAGVPSAPIAIGEKSQKPAGALKGDFNGDGFPDLAVGVTGDRVAGVWAGSVNVLYGSPQGLSSANSQLWNQNSPGIKDSSERFDFFGSSLAAGDFDGDGFGDLAIGVPLESLGSVEQAGAINVLYGSPRGLSSTGNQFWHQDSPGIKDTAEQGDHFGSALIAGDFNGDGFADLAVGVSWEAVGDVPYAGAVNVLYGSAAGLTAVGNQFWHQDSPGIEDAAEPFDYFGSALSNGDFNQDGYDDLAVGVPLEDIGDFESAGAVNVLYGSSSGLTADANQFWHQDSPGIEDVAESDDLFGGAVADGDFNGDGFADLVVGVVSEDLGNITTAGAVNVLYGSPSGLASAGNQFWHQDSPGIKGAAWFREQFGQTLSAGDYDGDGFDDLAAGVPYESPRRTSRFTGAVNVLYGSPFGLTADRNQLWHQDSPGVKDEAQKGDFFGTSAASRDYNNDGFSDLAVGVSGEDIDEGNRRKRQAGAANVLYGSAGGLSAAADQFWNQDSRGIPGEAKRNEGFGVSLSDP